MQKRCGQKNAYTTFKHNVRQSLGLNEEYQQAMQKKEDDERGRVKMMRVFVNEGGIQGMKMSDLKRCMDLDVITAFQFNKEKNRRQSELKKI